MKKIMLAFAIVISLFSFYSCTDLDDSFESETVEMATGGDEDDPIKPGGN